ncbi:hypothetical protein [Winogradskyella sp.]|nr:hypothetical protein [Winogradskyella sp.]
MYLYSKSPDKFTGIHLRNDELTNTPISWKDHLTDYRSTHRLEGDKKIY